MVCAGPCYRCLFPEAPEPQSCSSCSDAGVLGVVPGIIGSLQVLLAQCMPCSQVYLKLRTLFTYKVYIWMVTLGWLLFWDTQPGNPLLLTCHSDEPTLQWSEPANPFCQMCTGFEQALEAIKLASGVGSPLSRSLLLFDALAGRFTTVKLRQRVCSPHAFSC